MRLTAHKPRWLSTFLLCSAIIGLNMKIVNILIICRVLPLIRDLAVTRSDKNGSLSNKMDPWIFELI